MTKADKYMNDTINDIFNCGYKDVNPRPKYRDGTPAHTISINHNFRTYDLSKGEFPICTLRPIAWKTGIKEIFTIYQKPTNEIAEMERMGVNWWGDWDIGDGTIGQRYGATVKRYKLVDRLIKDIKTDPYGRRKVMSLWQETDLRETEGLAPCAFLTMWNVRQGEDAEYLDMVLVQRSGDMLTASGPGCINEVQYAAFLMMIARHCGYKPGVFSHLVANEQIYDRHMDAAQILRDRYWDTIHRDGTPFNPPPAQILRDRYWDTIHRDGTPFNPPPAASLVLSDSITDFYDVTIDDFTMLNYSPIKPQLQLELGI